MYVRAIFYFQKDVVTSEAGWARTNIWVQQGKNQYSYLDPIWSDSRAQESKAL